MRVRAYSVPFILKGIGFMISSKNKGQQAAKSSLPVLVIGLPVRAVCRGVQNTPVFFEL